MYVSFFLFVCCFWACVFCMCECEHRFVDVGQRKEEKEKGETLSLNSVVESESTNVMEAQTGEARKETELDQRDEETKLRETKKKKKKHRFAHIEIHMYI